MDWKTTVDQLIAADSTPVNNAKAQKTTNTTKLNALTALQDDLSALQTSVKALDDGDSFAQRAAKFADSGSTWSATASAGTETGDYVFNVSQLATKAARTGSASLGAPISSTNTVTNVTLATMNLGTAITAGNFSINGVKIDVAVTDSLSSVFQRISDKTSGAVTASYDAKTDTISLKSTSAITVGSAGDTSNFLTALKLYNSTASGTSSSGYTLQTQGKLGVPVLTATLENAKLKTAISAVDLKGNGSFSINGVTINFNAKTDSIQAVIGRINASSAGVLAAYDRANDQFTLTNKTTGNVGLNVSESTGGVLEALGLNATATPTSGQNAKFTINGSSSIISTSNTFGSDVTGITGLSVTAATAGSQTVNVSSDNTALTTKLNDFIEKYNTVQDYLSQQTKISTNSDGSVSTSTLSGNLDISAIGSKLRNLVFHSASGLSGSIKRLADIGIDFQSSSSDLQIADSTKLENALNTNASDVATLFTNSTDGLATALSAYVNKITGYGGTLSSETAALNKQNTDLDKQIERLNSQLDAERTRLTNSFVQMESAQSSLKSELQSLQSTFGTSSSASSTVA